MLVGYCRVSTIHQRLDRQLDALRAAGCERIYAEKVSARSIRGRPELSKAIDSLGAGDVLVFAEWDRCTRSLSDGIQIMGKIGARGAAIRVLDREHLDLTTPLGRGLLALLSALAEDERERIVRRANEGRTAARKRGVTMGRKPKMTAHQRKRADQMMAEGMSLREIAREFNVHHTTISRLK